MSASAGKKDGKKKLSKAEKEKLKKEEAEKKAQEEEEARLRELEEKRLAKQQEKLKASERKKLENEERRIRMVQMSELMEIIEANKILLEEKNEERRKKAKWGRYMRCDGSPDPTIQGEINTYINLRIENSDREDDASVLKDSELDLSLIEELEFLLADDPPAQPRMLDHYTSTIKELQALIDRKLDKASLSVLCNATKLNDPETYNLQHVARNSSICLCIWGNLSLNARIKHYEFHEKGFNFEIPRILTLTRCAVRVLFTTFDHLSPSSKAFFPRRKKKEEPVPEEEPKEGEGEKEGEEAEKPEGEGEDAEDAEGTEREPTDDLMAQLRQLEQAENPEEEEEEKKEEEEEVVEDFEDPPTPEPPEWDDFEEDDDVVDLRAFQVMGGIFKFDLLVMPPQPKGAKSWTITTIVDPPRLEKMEYSAQVTTPTGEKKDNKDADDKKKEEKPPVTVTMRLPEDVCFMEEPTIARWDEKKKLWRLDGFAPSDESCYKEAERQFKFTTFSFGTMALLQDVHINMPFQSWEIRPHCTNAAVLNIIAAIIDVEIEIKDGMCCLSQPADKPELEAIRNKWVTPQDLVLLMRKAGVNLFPSEDSSKYVSIQDKHPLVEKRAYQQMAMLASSTAFTWSKWNSEVKDRDKVIFQTAEALEDEPLLEKGPDKREDWSLIMLTKRRAVKLKMTEFDETFSDEMSEDTEYQSNLYHLLQKTASPEAWERVKETNYEFVDCVEKLLSFTQILTYS